MNFVDAVKTCFRKYIDISGRAARSEYWWFFLFVFIIDLVAMYISPNLYYLALVIFFCPTIAVGVRRFHDIDMSGWWLLLGLIPFLGALVLIYFFVQEGTKGPNRFGNPVVV